MIPEFFVTRNISFQIM